MSFKITTHGDFGVSSSGTRIVDDRIDLADELFEQFHPVAKAVAKEAAEMMLAEIDRQLNLAEGTARTAAPEGAPPERDTGDLAESFTIIAPRVKGRVVSSGVQSDHPGGNRLENGSTDSLGRRTLPHPFIAPALRAVEPAVDALVRKRLGS